MSAHVSVKEVHCTVCDATVSVEEACGPDYDCHCCGDQVFSLVKCSKCSTYYLNPRPTADALPIIYSSENYYSYSFSDEANSIVFRAKVNRDKQKVKEIIEFSSVPVSEMRVIDIGAGDGSFLSAFEQSGFKPESLCGLELNQSAVENLNSKGFQGIFGRVEETEFPENFFDCVAMIQVIEHITSPKLVIQNLHRSMKPGGILLLETPNMASWDRKFFRRKTWGGYHFPRHWTLWDPATITSMLRDCGFDVVRISTPPAAVLWVWSINHVMQEKFGDGLFAKFFSIGNPFALGVFWFLELIPSILCKSANMRIYAKARKGKDH